MSHLKIWQQAQKKVEETVARVKSFLDSFSREREELQQRIAKYREDVKNADSKDRQFMLSDLLCWKKRPAWADALRI
ncbi:MAG: hypothetical protein ACOX2G_13245 [Bacillota bacterium]|jgi:phage shock protein A